MSSPLSFTEDDLRAPAPLPKATWIYGAGAKKSLTLHLFLHGLDPESTVWVHPKDTDDWKTYTDENIVIFETDCSVNEISAIARWVTSPALAVWDRHMTSVSRVITPERYIILAETGLTSPILKLALGHLFAQETYDEVAVSGNNRTRGYFAIVRRSAPPTKRAYATTQEADREQRGRSMFRVDQCVNCRVVLTPGETDLCNACCDATHRPMRFDL